MPASATKMLSSAPSSLPVASSPGLSIVRTNSQARSPAPAGVRRTAWFSSIRIRTATIFGRHQYLRRQERIKYIRVVLWMRTFLLFFFFSFQSSNLSFSLSRGPWAEATLLLFLLCQAATPANQNAAFPLVTKTKHCLSPTFPHKLRGVWGDSPH